MTKQWTLENIPDQSGRIVIVTGANRGIGYETTLALARKNALIVLACRNLSKGEEALRTIRHQVPTASLELMHLDLARLASVREFASDFCANFDRLDLLFNNAGIMAIPHSITEDGFEMQMGVNYLAHFGLTGLLLHRLLQTSGSRVVSATSDIANLVKMDFDDLQSEKKYSRYHAYAQSKLAIVLFAFELDRKLAGVDTRSMVAHSGFTDTDIQDHAAQFGPRIEKIMYRVAKTLLAQSPAQGILPQLYAATAFDAKGGVVYAPRFMKMRGQPTVVASPKSATPADAARLWTISEELTGIKYEFPS